MEHEAQSFDRRAFLLEMGAYDGVTVLSNPEMSLKRRHVSRG